ncbi:MAG: Asp-tRNA(Asn)/Glu-tRNA(Gln) amidotransferase subunit GatA [Nitrospirae bacterium]|nr:Asp-tRNA(Asn)/Glu-tRNA(Gln) amidotransferase subunit GatA [Nitrospirota bacterium]
MELFRLTIAEALRLLLNKEISNQELLKAVFDRIKNIDSKINAYVTITEEEAFNRLNKVSKTSGIPIAIKDNLCTKGIKTTCSSKILGNFIPPYESTVTQKLINSEYIFTGKTNLDEFAMGSSTENSGFFPTKNPWDTSRVPGGSSGGSAAAVASGMCIAALGSDTGGSIRQPAAFCGVVGLKPTYGRVSRFGLIAFASSLDQIGPITKNVEDCAILMNILSGHDINDSTCANIDVPDYTANLKNGVKGLTIGIPKEYFIEGIDKETLDAVKKAINILSEMGAEVIPISLPHTEYSIAVYYILATSEASSNLARFDGVKYGLRIDGKNLLDMYLNTKAAGFGKEVKRRILLGTYSLSSGYYDAYYKKAQAVRTLIRKDFADAFKKVDVIITPTTPTPAFKIGEKVADPLKMYLNDIFTTPVNLAGIPAISIPCGFSKEGLPIGLQIIGRDFDEETLLRTSYTFEHATEHHKRIPSI